MSSSDLAHTDATQSYVDPTQAEIAVGRFTDRFPSLDFAGQRQIRVIMRDLVERSTVSAGSANKGSVMAITCRMPL